MSPEGPGELLKNWSVVTLPALLAGDAISNFFFFILCVSHHLGYVLVPPLHNELDDLRCQELDLLLCFGIWKGVPTTTISPYHSISKLLRRASGLYLVQLYPDFSRKPCLCCILGKIHCDGWIRKRILGV